MRLYALAQRRRFSKENHGEIGSTTMSLYDSARDNLVKWHFKVNEPSKDLTIDKLKQNSIERTLGQTLSMTRPTVKILFRCYLVVVN